MSLLAAAAVIATLAVARQRNEPGTPDPPPEPGRMPAAPPANLDLDALRSAGF